MKTAQEWQTELAGETSIESIHRIQTDAIIEGMLRGATIVDGFREDGDGDLRCIRDNIKYAAKELTTP